MFAKIFKKIIMTILKIKGVSMNYYNVVGLITVKIKMFCEKVCFRINLISFLCLIFYINFRCSTSVKLGSLCNVLKGLAAFTGRLLLPIDATTSWVNLTCCVRNSECVLNSWILIGSRGSCRFNFFLILIKSCLILCYVKPSRLQINRPVNMFIQVYNPIVLNTISYHTKFLYTFISS